MKKMIEKEIDTRMFFIPMHQQLVFQKMDLFKEESYPVAGDISREGMYLPSGSGLKEEEIKFICDAIKDIKEDMK